MPDNGTTAPPVPNAGANGAAASGQPKVPGARTDADKRIQELAAQKAHFQQKANAYAGELADLRERMARLEGRTEAQAPQATSGSTPRSWDQMTDVQLDEALSWATENTNHAALTQAVNEKVRRAQERAATEAVKRSQETFETGQYARDIKARIVSDFGADAFDPSSELYQAADRHMSAYVERYGKDVVKGQPDKLYDAFLRAEREVRVARERDDFKRLQEEHAALQQKATLLERGQNIAMGAPLNDQVQEALKTGDVRNAIRNTGLVRGLSQDAMRRFSR